ncbi:MAG: undecaprenyl-diphosphate phosphatase [Armatimonadota bacterium]
MLDLVVLGIVQGLTEFLPVSSTAHLLFVEHYLGIPRPGLVLEAILHLGTAVAATVMFWPDVIRILRSGRQALARLVSSGARPPDPSPDPYGRMAITIVVATLVTGVLGLAFAGPLERMFESVRGTAFQLIITGVILLAHQERGVRTAADLTVGDGLVLGIAQAAAIVPGISRSGTTIVGGLGLGLKRIEAARISFLMSIPAILGAGAFVLKDAGEAARLGYTPLQLVVGGAVAGLFGALSIVWLLGVVRRQRLIVFSVYCWLAGALVLVTTR